MAINDIFPITQDPKQTEGQPSVAQDVDIVGETTELGNASPFIEDAPTLDTLINKVSTRRAMPKEDEPFGKDLSLGRAQLMEQEASGSPVQYQMMAGKYFANLPLITGKFSSQLPVAAMMAQDEEAGPAQKQLDTLMKKIMQPKWFPQVSALGEDIFAHDVLDKYDEAYDIYGRRAAQILNGGGKTKEERAFGREFMEAVNGVSNLAALTQKVGKYAEDLRKEKGTYQDPAAQEFITNFLDGLPKMRGASKEEFFEYLNKGSAILDSNIGFGKFVKENIQGVPQMDELVKGMFGKAADALEGRGEQAGGLEIISQIGADTQSAAQLDAIAQTAFNEGYTFGLPEDEAKNEIKRRLLHNYWEKQKIFYIQPRQTAGQREAEKFRVSPTRQGKSKMDDGTFEQVRQSTLTRVGGGKLPAHHFPIRGGNVVLGIPTGALIEFEKSHDGKKFMAVAVPNKNLSYPKKWKFMADDARQEWLDQQYANDPNNFKIELSALEGSTKDYFEDAFGRSVDDVFPGTLGTGAKPKREPKAEITFKDGVAVPVRPSATKEPVKGEKVLKKQPY